MISLYGSLTNIDYWRQQQVEISYNIQGEWIYGRYLDRFMPRGEGLSCLEVGVYPGKHLLYLAQKYRYRVTGVDFSPYLSCLNAVFRNKGVDATFVKTDFLDWEPGEQFNVVVSHGFIEHFDDYQGVIERHWQWVKPSGLLVLSVPVLTPFQRAVRLITYTSEHWRSILDTHNTEIMNLQRLRNAVSRCDVSEILLARYVNWMTVWFDAKSPGVRHRTEPVFKLLRQIESIARKLDICNGVISPEIVVAARKIVVD